jgi:hypothetical protein
MQVAKKVTSDVSCKKVASDVGCKKVTSNVEITINVDCEKL